MTDINYNKSKYPVFYIPSEVKKQEMKYVIRFDSSIYINKKAISFIVDRVNEETSKTGKIESINNRIIYLSNDEENFIEVVQSIFNDITNHFELPQNISIKSRYQQSKSLFVSASNSLHLYIADKSDEALINDYEELLEILKGDNPLSRFFNTLLENFITKNPEKDLPKIISSCKGIVVVDEQTPSGNLSSCVFEGFSHQNYFPKIISKSFNATCSLFRYN